MALEFLDTKHRIYTLHEKGWEREERRMYGLDAVLEEVVQFTGEGSASYTARKASATYVNFPKAHAQVVTGQLRLHGPTPEKGLSFGELGEIRERDKVDEPTLAELLYYNVDGIGSDGSEFPAFMDAVDERAQATGHRWLMVETPQWDGVESGTRPSKEAVIAGFRPYVVEYSPLDVTNWFFRAGQLQFAVIRVPVGEPTVEGGQFKTEGDSGDKLGYYLLVRAGYKGLGAEFAGGGWWLYDHERNELNSKPWANTGGQIPLWIHYGEKSSGTTKLPALSRSSTMELGQIAVSLMNTISARDYDAWDAAASRLYFLGADAQVMQDVAAQVTARSILIGVPVAASLQGNQDNRVQVYDGSMGAVPAGVFSTIIEAKFNEAKEQSFQKITSTPESTGISKEAGHQQEKAPYLARRAALRQGSEQTLIYFAELRSGFAKPRGYSKYEREFDLAPVVDDIEATLSMLKRSWLRSPTWERDLLLRAGDERGLLPDEKALRDKIAQELEASATPTEPEHVLEGDEGETPGRRPPAPQQRSAEEAVVDELLSET
jgi:hypothetical protein